MVVPGLIQQTAATAYHAGFWFTGSEYEALDSRMNHCPRTHRARFQGNVQSRVGKSVIRRSGGGCPHGNDLRMGAGIIAGDHLVPALSQYFPGSHNNSPYRYLTRVGCPVGQFQGTTHPLFVPVAILWRRQRAYSHSIVAGGLLLIS